MFKLFQNNAKVKVFAPITGKMITLEKVPDKVFASKMMGEGVAFDLDNENICAPIDGKITLIPQTKHAFCLLGKFGIEVLVHIGLDTVNLNGEGFTQLVKVGEKVSVGTPIIKVNKSLIQKHGFNLITPMVITNSSNFNLTFPNSSNKVSAGKSTVMECKKK